MVVLVMGNLKEFIDLLLIRHEEELLYALLRAGSPPLQAILAANITRMQLEALFDRATKPVLLVLARSCILNIIDAIGIHASIGISVGIIYLNAIY